MGDSQATRWRWLGYAHFLRTRGKETLQAVEPWVKIAVVGAPAAHYLGLSSGWSVAFGLSIIVGSEIAMLALGWFDHRQGVIQTQQQWLNEQDPWRMEVLAILRQVAQTPSALATIGRLAEDRRRPTEHMDATESGLLCPVCGTGDGVHWSSTEGD